MARCPEVSGQSSWTHPDHQVFQEPIGVYVCEKGLGCVCWPFQDIFQRRMCCCFEDRGTCQTQPWPAGWLARLISYLLACLHDAYKSGLESKESQGTLEHPPGSQNYMLPSRSKVESKSLKLEALKHSSQLGFNDRKHLSFEDLAVALLLVSGSLGPNAQAVLRR